MGVECFFFFSFEDLRHPAWCTVVREQAFAPALLPLRAGCIALPADSVGVRSAD